MNDETPFHEHVANVKEAQRVYNNANRHAILAAAVSMAAVRITTRIMALPVVSIIGVMLSIVWLDDREAMWSFLVAFITGHAAQIVASIKYIPTGCRAFITSLASAMAFSSRAVNALGDDNDKTALLRALRAAMNMEDLLGYGDVYELLRRLPAKERVRIKVHVEKEMGNFKELTDQQLADLF